MKTRSDIMMGNQRARKVKIKAVTTNRERFLGALWNALNCSMNSDEVLELMDALNAESAAKQMRDIYLRSKTKGQRQQALEDVKAYRNFR